MLQRMGKVSARAVTLLLVMSVSLVLLWPKDRIPPEEGVPTRRGSVIILVHSGGSNDNASTSRADTRLGYATHLRRPQNRVAILETWGTEDTWFVTHEPVKTGRIIRLPASVEQAGYTGLIEKTRATLTVMHDKFLTRYDWFMKVR